MKISTNKSLITLCLLLNSIVLLAQPDPDAMPGDLDAMDSPINDNILIMVAVAILYAGYKYYSKKQIAK